MVLNVNTHKTNVITGKECITLYGPGVLHDTMRGVPVALGPLSFYQVNTEGANRLYGVAADFAALPLRIFLHKSGEFAVGYRRFI